MSGSSRDDVRAHLIEVAGELLAAGGPGAMTTRSVAQAAGVQAPTIYRLFGDKLGLLDAVVSHGFTSYVGTKHIDPDGDPVVGLRAGWELHVGFGLANPALFRLMHAALPSSDEHAAVEAGMAVLQERVRRVAVAGRLRVSERRAVDLIRAAGTGVVLTLIDTPADSRDEGLADAAWAAVEAAILTDTPRATAGPSAAAVELRAALPELPQFSPAERTLLAEWLNRLAD
jgi:AcrR family transcriptional regulator